MLNYFYEKKPSQNVSNLILFILVIIPKTNTDKILGMIKKFLRSS